MAIGIDRGGALKKAFEFIYKSEIIGDYYEFGVYQGVSLCRALEVDITWAKKTKRKNIVNFYGFDSFEGLPYIKSEDHLDGYEVFQQGQFSGTRATVVMEEITRQGLPLERVTLVEGFYSKALKSDATKKLLQDSRVAIAHIDCDLYSSASECLDFLNSRLIDGAVLLFDDWYCYRGRSDKGVHRAFDEWIKSTGYNANEYFSYSWAGKAFIINIGDCC